MLIKIVRILSMAAIVNFSTISFSNHHEHKHDEHKHDEHKEKKSSSKSHVHGEGKMNFVTDGNKIVVEFEISSEDILGFEHKPKSDAQKKSLSDALVKVKKPFVVAEGCKLSGTPSVEGGVLSAKSDSAHSDFLIVQTYECKKLSGLKKLQVVVFDEFPKISELKVQGVLTNTTVVQTVNKTKSYVKLEK